MTEWRHSDKSNPAGGCATPCYTDVVTEWIQQAAARAGEETAIDARQLARLIVAGVDGLILQYVVDPDPDRGRADIEKMIAMVIRYADVRPAAGS